jgi:hypothetical protein
MNAGADLAPAGALPVLLLLPREQRGPPHSGILPTIRRTDAVVASGGTKESAMTKVLSTAEITEACELSVDDLDQVAGGGQFFVPTFRADIREGERFASGYVQPFWGAVC